MFNLAHVREQLRSSTHPPSSQVFRDLIASLEHGQAFDLTRLDGLCYHEFEMAVESIREWRTLRYIRADDPVYTDPLHE